MKFIAICPGATETPLMDFEKFYAKRLFPSMVDEVKLLCKNVTVQEYVTQFVIPKIAIYKTNISSVDIVGACVIAALDDGENGSTWQCDNGRIEKLKIFDYPTF